MFKVIAILLIIAALGYSQVNPECGDENQVCGGIKQIKCCLGHQLKCDYETPIHPEASGVCKKICSQEGERCLGYTLDPQLCCGGLSCVEVDPRLPDLPGKCTNITV